MRKIILITIGAFVFLTTLWGQNFIRNSETLLIGFSEKISGIDFGYSSTIPGYKGCMLVRASTGKQFMEWKTEPVPGNYTQKEAVFLWLAGLGSNLGNAKMIMTLNGIEELAFYTSRKEDWEVKSTGGVTLSFVANAVDGAGDLFGFMFLRVPMKMLKKGEPATIRVTGSASNSRAWYMAFKRPLESGISMTSSPAIIQSESGSAQVIGVNIYHFGPHEKAELFIDGNVVRNIDLHFGHQFYRITIPETKIAREIKLRIESPSLNDEQKLTILPVRKWHVNFVQHSHTDIGYTRAQDEILAEHLRFIDYALDYCDQTDDYPDDAKFRWTCEASWPVDEYLKLRPRAQINRLKKRIEEGRIEITGMYFNFDELPDEQTLAASLQPLKRFREYGIPVKAAMQDDVNGIAWCFSDYFPQMGVKYLNMGTHGHRALICFDKPTAFWWESPSGSRMLAFRAEHYMTGNSFGIHAGDFNQFENELLNYLEELEEKAYPYDIIHIQHSGFSTDNSPPSTLSSEMIKRWNEIYEWPKLRSATVSEFFEVIKEYHSDNLPVYKAAWPDWWTDGFGSGARELAASRDAHVDLIANTGGMSMAIVMGADMPEGFTQRVEEVNRALLFYDEHTFGSSESVSDPYGESTMVQRRQKEAYAWEAFKRARIIGEEVMGQLQSKILKTDVPTLAVFNTLNWKRSGMITVYIDHQIIPKGRKFRIVDENGIELKTQAFNHRSDGTYWGIWVNDIPEFGYKNFRIELLDGYDNQSETSNNDNSVLENEWYKVIIDQEKGAISSIYDKRLKTELVDPEAEYQLGTFIYERLGGRSQMEGYTLVDYNRYLLDTVYVESVTKGPMYDVVRFVGENKACCYEPQGFKSELRLYHTEPLIEMYFTLQKRPVTDPEGVYIAFPFQVKEGKIFCDVSGGVMEAGVDQIPGSSNDWNTVQNFVSVRNDEMQVVFGSHEAPLMQFGGINTGRYKAGATPETTHIYSWPMNNYWVTNFNADQQGSFTWSYFVTTRDNNQIKDATRIGWENRIPFLPRVLPAGNMKNPLISGSVFDFSSDNLLLINTKPINESTLLIQMREVNGTETDLRIFSPGKSGTYLLQSSDVTGEPLAAPEPELHFNPYETKFIIIDLKQ